MSKLATVLVCLTALLLSACASSVAPQPDTVSGQPVDAGGPYCQAVQTLLVAQPSAALGGESLSTSMTFYGNSAERLAELSPSDEAEILFELAETARLIAADPTDLEHAQRFATMVTPVAAVTVRASQQCGFAG